VHGLQHVVHQGAQRIIDHVDARRDLFQDRIGDDEDVSQGHGAEVGLRYPSVKLGQSPQASSPATRRTCGGVSGVSLVSGRTAVSSGSSSSTVLPSWSTFSSSKRRAWVRTWVSSEPTNW